MQAWGRDMGHAGPWRGGACSSIAQPRLACADTLCRAHGQCCLPAGVDVILKDDIGGAFLNPRTYAVVLTGERWAVQYPQEAQHDGPLLALPHVKLTVHTCSAGHAQSRVSERCMQ